MALSVLMSTQAEGEVKDPGERSASAKFEKDMKGRYALTFGEP